ncbi:NblA/ycf18 family protein [Pleurocapsa sp. PCC 7319]|uniref:NblA/ycf18 family protein n=1 Tax=Pleurocapsa sp. PCC 7319 TaxID=118161 RepID=UPI000378808E|nr:NblA/ycf18 family protein [Pleurocapsa sp. PCC 7319]
MDNKDKNNNKNNNTIGQLSLEQQFQLQVLEREIEHLTLDQAKEYLREAFRQIMVKENVCKEMFKECYL